MPQNIEVKLKVASLEEVEDRAIRSGARRAGVLVQRDTFFRCGSGRLKLREIEHADAELIAYARSDEPAARASDYAIFHTDDPAALHEVLARSLEVTGVVSKRRTLLLWRNVRIHLDRVENLGEFVELESVVGEVGAEVAGEHLAHLLELLGLGNAEIVPVAYLDLLASNARSIRES